MPIKVVLRLVWAAVFAIVAIIFSELLPPLGSTNPLLLRVLVTITAALVGFIIFPGIATTITRITISLFNLSVARVSSEIMSQIMRLPRQHGPIFNPTPSVGGVSLSRPLILDTSAIIDGRVLDVAKTGFISGLVLVPNFVLLELQQVADSADNLKRSRGRRGFEIIESLKKTPGVKLEIWDKDAGGKAVDERLIKLAKNLQGKLITTDFNLNKVASAHGIIVLNINDLSNGIKASVLPGEKIDIKIVHLGKDSKQGIGYLPDGTMIVVEDGAQLIGKTVKVEISRFIQGSAGKMVFGKLG